MCVRAVYYTCIKNAIKTNTLSHAVHNLQVIGHFGKIHLKIHLDEVIRSTEREDVQWQNSELGRAMNLPSVAQLFLEGT